MSSVLMQKQKKKEREKREKTTKNPTRKCLLVPDMLGTLTAVTVSWVGAYVHTHRNARTEPGRCFVHQRA